MKHLWYLAMGALLAQTEFSSVALSRGVVMQGVEGK